MDWRGIVVGGRSAWRRSLGAAPTLMGLPMRRELEDCPGKTRPGGAIGDVQLEGYFHERMALAGAGWPEACCRPHLGVQVGC